jgi:hypothetical protein
MNARMYDETMPTFLSLDPASQYNPEKLLIDPQQLNLYAYARNNPIRYNDPSGETIWDAVNGFVNAYGSDMALGIGRIEADFYNGNAGDYGTGQSIGDFVGMISGSAVTAGGITTAGAGGLVTGLSPATGPGVVVVAPAGVGMTAAGVTAATYGAGVAGVSAYNFSQNNNKNSDLNLTDHAIERMGKRKVSTEDVAKTMKENKPVTYFHNGAFKNGYRDPASGTFVGQSKSSGRILTVINNTGKNYLSNLVSKGKAILSKLKK